MKRFMCFLLCVCLIMPVFPSVSAADTELTEIVKMAKAALSIPVEYTEFESHKQEIGGEAIYTLMWSVKDSMKRIYCEVRGEDIVVYESFDPEKEKRTGKAEFSKDEYAALAKTWFEKINPAYSKELAETGEVELGNANSRAVRVSFARVLNGVEVQGNRVYFSLDKFTGEIISMNASWTTAETAEKNENLITSDAAGNELVSLTGLYLKYKKLPKEDRAIIVFEPSRRGIMLSAALGEEFLVEYDENFRVESPMAPGGAMTEDSATNGALTENEIKAIDEISSFITKDEIEAKIKKMAGSAVASYTLQSVSYTKVEKEEDEYTYHVRASLRGDGNAFGEVVFNAESGELLSFYSYAPNNGSKSYDKDYDTLKKTAESFVKAHAPTEAEKVRLSEEAGSGSSFLFSRFENDIEYRENYVSLVMNKKTGKITSFSKSWDDKIVFDDAEELISQTQAEENFLSSSEVGLFYVPNGVDMYTYGSARELCLIYMFKGATPEYIDAKTGEALTWELIPPVEEKEYELQADLKGHFSESAVQTLADNGTIVTKEEEFIPDAAVTYFELARIIFSFRYGSYIEPDKETYEDLLREAISLGYIDKDTKGETFVTREAAAESIVRLLGVGKAVGLSGIYKTGFSDEKSISPSKLGAVALAKGFGVVRGDGGAFFPQRVLTRGELCVMLANSYGK